MTFTILFVGDRNLGRSVLAAARTRAELHRIWPRAADEVRTQSVGLNAPAGVGAPDNLLTVAARRDLVLDEHAATPLDPAVLERADLVLTMSRRLRAQILLQFPAARPRTFAMLEYVAAGGAAAAQSASTSHGRGKRLEERLRTATRSIASAVDRQVGDDTDWDLFDPYAYSLDIHETVAGIVDTACTSLVHNFAVLTGARGSRASSSRTA